MATQVVPTHPGYVVADIDGPANGQNFGKGAVTASAMGAKDIIAAIRLSRAHIRPQDVVDYDLYESR